MSPDKLIAFVIVFSQIIPPAKSITTAYFNIQKGMASIDRINQILDADEKITEKETALAVTGFNDSIEFKGVFCKILTIFWHEEFNSSWLKDSNLIRILEFAVISIKFFNYLTILETTPAPIVRPPSLMAKRIPSSIATG